MLFKQCKHDWEIIQEVTTQSKGELRISQVGEIPMERDRIDFEEFWKRKHITILKCNTCGKLKRFVEEI